jgi:putative endonuclease
LSASTKCWYLYLLRCADGSLYTGITVDLERRFSEHQDVDGKGKGAKALRGKGPLKLVFNEQIESHSQALKLEYRIKQLNKADKENLIRQGNGLQIFFDDVGS